MVGVKKSTLKKYTAVSEQTAKEMAKGGAFMAESDACVSVTGYAGPDGGRTVTRWGLSRSAAVYTEMLKWKNIILQETVQLSVNRQLFVR